MTSWFHRDFGISENEVWPRAMLRQYASWSSASGNRQPIPITAMVRVVMFFLPLSDFSLSDLSLKCALASAGLRQLLPLDAQLPQHREPDLAQEHAAIDAAALAHEI